MSFIKFNVARRTDEYGNTVYGKITRIESDMPQSSTLETNIMWHALTKLNDIRLWLKLDEGKLDRDILGESDALILVSSMLNIDTIM